jgi:hypothetical protein
MGFFLLLSLVLTPLIIGVCECEEVRGMLQLKCTIAR